MKALNFSMFLNKLISGEKQQKILKFKPDFREDEIIWIKHKKRRLFEAKVIEIYHKRLKEITQQEAQQDGFKSRRECIVTTMKFYDFENIREYCFIVKFRQINRKKNSDKRDLPLFKSIMDF
ncbi:MAG: ASCH domain-containing protein [Promethearchaeia archaeon]